MEKPESLWAKSGSPTEHAAAPADPEKARRQKKGIIWLLAPIISLPIVLVLHAVVRVVASRTIITAATSAGELGARSSAATFFNIANVVLSLTPIILIPLGIIMGLYYFLKK